MSPDVPPLLVLWEEVAGEVLDRTRSFPRAARFSFAARIDGLALDILERLVVACWTAGARKREALEEADLALARLRVLLRLSHARRFLDGRGLALLARRLDEAGRMLGGWRRQQAGG